MKIEKRQMENEFSNWSAANFSLGFTAWKLPG